MDRAGFRGKVQPDVIGVFLDLAAQVRKLPLGLRGGIGQGAGRLGVRPREIRPSTAAAPQTAQAT